MRDRLNMDLNEPKDENLLRDFVEDYLREDLVLMFRLLSLHQSKDRIVCEILPNLFRFFKTKRNQLSIDLERIKERLKD